MSGSHPLALDLFATPRAIASALVIPKKDMMIYHDDTKKGIIIPRKIHQVTMSGHGWRCDTCLEILEDGLKSKDKEEWKTSYELHSILAHPQLSGNVVNGQTNMSRPRSLVPKLNSV